MSFQEFEAMFKAMCFKNKHGDPYFSMFYFYFLALDDPVCKKLETLNHNFNDNHTSLKDHHQHLLCALFHQ